MKPHLPGDRIDTNERDPKNELVGIVGYEVSFNCYCYRCTPPRPWEGIEADIRQVEKEIVTMLRVVTEGR